MEHTANYNLTQWAMTDRIQMQDFNADNAKIDAALSAHAAKLATCGNCQIGLMSYVGTGKGGSNHPNSLTFPQKPALVIVGINSCFSLLLFPCDGSYTWLDSYYNIKWEGNTVSWYSSVDHQLNKEGTTYYVVAFYPADE